MKCLPIVAVAAVMLFASTTLAATTADIVFVVDESGSMNTEHAWLAPMVAVLDAELIAAGVTNNRYGLVGFGSANPDPRQISVGGGQFGNAAQFATATTNLLLNGGFEDGYDGIDFALDYAFRNEAAVNVILITDEDRDVNDAGVTFNSLTGELNALNALLNVVVDASFVGDLRQTALGIDGAGTAYIADGLGGYTTTPNGNAVSGFGTTIADYVNLATGIGGAAWDLNQLRAGGMTAQSFTAAFVDIKVTEIKEQPAIPEPGTFALLGGALGLMLVVRRRRKV